MYCMYVYIFLHAQKQFQKHLLHNDFPHFQLLYFNESLDFVQFLNETSKG